jgi:hypothetical protein
MKSERGQALPMAIMALTIGALVIAPFLGHAGNSIIGSRTYANSIAAQSSADAGVENAIWGLTYGTLDNQIPSTGNHITYQLGEALNGFTPSVTVTTNATGVVTGNITKSIIDTLQFDAANGYTPDMIKVSPTVVAIAYRGTTNKGYLVTASMAADGTIGNSVISTMNFDGTACYEPDITYVSGNYYAIVYRSSANTGFIKTVTITSAGVIGGSIVSSFTFDTTACYTPSLIQVNSTVYAIAYRGASNKGDLQTISISASGIIGGTGSPMIFDASTCYEPCITYVSGVYYAIAYRGAINKGYVKTVTISATGTIGASVISTLNFETTGCWEPNVVQVASTIFAIAYRATSSGLLKTVSISASGIIGASVISTLTFDAAVSNLPNIKQVGSNTFAIAYGSSTNKGYLKTVSIASNGTITSPVIDTYNFNTSSGYEPYLVPMSGNIFAIAYRGPSNHGYLITIGIATNSTPAAYSIISIAGGVTINAFVTVTNTTATIVSWEIQ